MNHQATIRQTLILSITLLGLLFAMPLAVVAPFHRESEAPPVQEPEEPLAVNGGLDSRTVLHVLNKGEVLEMSLDAYLEGVVRAEMPASFEPEALRAQTVAARTYTLYKLQTGGNHGETADICTDSTCCQAYLEEETARKNWGDAAERYEKKVEEAVADTDGEVILYGGVPVLAVFHSSSAGRTRAAGEVWQSDLPYLQPVDSPEEDDVIPNYYSRAEFTTAELKEKLLAACPEAQLSGEAAGWLGKMVADAAGNVETVEVGGVSVKGSTLRNVLGLRSACFEWEVQGDRVVFYTTGYGHGVGMSQYGANEMAREGATYREILTHYYTGVTVEPYSLAGRAFTNQAET